MKGAHPSRSSLPERDPIKCNRITLQIALIVAQSFGEPLTLRRIALYFLVSQKL